MQDYEKDPSLNAPEMMAGRQHLLDGGVHMLDSVVQAFFGVEEQEVVTSLQPHQIVDLYKPQVDAEPASVHLAMPKAVMNEIDHARAAVAAVFTPEMGEEDQEDAALAA